MVPSMFLASTMMLSPLALVLTASLLHRAQSTRTSPSSASHNLFQKDPRIIGGTETSSTRYPYAAALTNGGSDFFCGGSLIAPDVVLTAAHCLGGGGYNVAVGRHDLTSRDGEEVPVDTEIRHPRYSLITDEYDFALLILARSATVVAADDLVRINSDESFPSPGETARVMGWGDTAQDDQNTQTSDTLLEVDVPVISNDECAAAEGSENGLSDSYQDYIFDSMICTFSPGRDACQGDSGGPLIIPGSSADQDILIGVTSWGIGCATSIFPGVFARVATAYDWIAETVCTQSADPPGYLCGTPEPTPEPTAKPTPEPTPEPTVSPTTASPTLTPSDTPTESPTTSPPSLSPSKSPTGSPSTSPTFSPTATPSISSIPSSSPTLSPSLSFAPSDNPSYVPSAIPSSQPSQRPSDTPSAFPSLSPSTSGAPSLAPSASPTLSPTASSLPTTSTAPTPKAFRLGGNSLMIPISSLLAPEIEPVKALSVDAQDEVDGDASGSRGVGGGVLGIGVLLSGILSTCMIALC